MSTRPTVRLQQVCEVRLKCTMAETSVTWDSWSRKLYTDSNDEPAF